MECRETENDTSYEYSMSQYVISNKSRETNETNEQAYCKSFSQKNLKLENSIKELKKENKYL